MNLEQLTRDFQNVLKTEKTFIKEANNNFIFANLKHLNNHWILIKIEYGYEIWMCVNDIDTYCE